MHRRHKAGFSLVELSIVLVILGLLVGGVLAGRSLVQASELRAVTTEYDRYVTAIHTFRDKYMGIPGDITNATTIWGAAHGTFNTCFSTQGTGTQTCNGNGNAFIGSIVNIYTGAPDPLTGEDFRAWQHLANAGLVEGTYTGVAGPVGPIHSIVGTNVPGSRFPQSGWSLIGMDGTVSLFNGQTGNALAFGGNGVGENDYMNAMIMRAEDAYNLDMKLDDGVPNRGKVFTPPNATRPNCTNGSSTQYALSDTTKGCNLLFKLQ